MAHSLEEYLLKIGLPIELHNGIISMREEKQICKVGQVLTSNDTKILKLFQVEMVEFHMKIVSHWNKKDGYENYGNFDDSNVQEVDKYDEEEMMDKIDEEDEEEEEKIVFEKKKKFQKKK
jgi:hypothetical protein